MGIRARVEWSARPDKWPTRLEQVCAIEEDWRGSQTSYISLSARSPSALFKFWVKISGWSGMSETQPCQQASYQLEVPAMSKLAIWVQVEAKPGKEQAVRELLKSAQALAGREQGTLAWYAVHLGGATFGIFDTFADEKGREAHLTGEIAKALFGKAQELFVHEPEVHKLEILAAKEPGSAKAYGA
jgi:quinol monooxygenase YgiN